MLIHEQIVTVEQKVAAMERQLADFAARLAALETAKPAPVESQVIEQPKIVEDPIPVKPARKK